MNISTKCAEALIWFYKGANRIGLLDAPLTRSLYISTYFTYKKYLEDPYARLVKHHKSLFRNGHILDIGANIGYTSFVFSKAIDKNFKIFAFEPEKRNVEILNQVSQKYGFANRFVSVAAAVGNREGQIELWRNEAHNGDHRILTEEFKKQFEGNIPTQKTPLITIDNYLKKQSGPLDVSFIKIDVQGYEIAVCEGMRETLARNPEAIIGFEYCPSILEALGFHAEDLLSFFKNLGYQFYYLNKKNVFEIYDAERRKDLLRRRPHDYIELFCARKNLIAF